MTDISIRLLEPVVTGGLATPRFFNGRLLSGEVLTQLQASEQARRQRLGAALGSGVIDGLWVEDGGGATPALRIRAGSALCPDGDVLRLAQDTLLSLAPTASAGGDAGGAGGDFKERVDEGAPAGPSAVPGVFMLIMGVTRQPRGRAPVSAGTAGTCGNVRDDVEGVTFRAASIVAPGTLPPDMVLRNAIAALCLGVFDAAGGDAGKGDKDKGGKGDKGGGKGGDAGVPSVPGARPTCLAPSEALTPSEVPLAVFQVGGGQVQFVDNWAVRRRVTASFPGDSAGTLLGPALLGRMFGDEHRSRMEAMAFQFSIQAEGMSSFEPLSNRFVYLPPAGLLTGGGDSADWWRFPLGQLAPPEARTVSFTNLLAIFRSALDLEPIEIEGEDTAVDVYLSEGVALFARSSRARLRVRSAQTTGGEAVLRARRVAPTATDPNAATPLDANVYTVASEGLATSFRYTVDLDPGTYQLEVGAGGTTYRALVELVGGKTLEHPFPLEDDGSVWQAVASPPAGEGRRVEVGLGSSATLPGGESGVWYRVGGWYFDPADWHAGVALALRVEGTVSTAAVVGKVRLVRAQDGAPVSAALPFWTTAPHSNETPIPTPLSPTAYVLQASCDAPDPGAAFSLLNARVIVTG